MVYLIPIILCLFLSVRYDQIDGKNYLGNYPKSKKLFIFIFCWLVVISALQYCVGYDIPIYMNAYKLNSNNSLSDIWGNARYRPGWLFLQVICHKISDNFVILKIVQAVFLSFCFYRFMSRYSKYWYMTLFFYILYPYGQLNYGAMRQSFAVGFFLLAVPYLEERDTKKETIIAYVKYVCLIYIGSFFHTSAFVLLFVPLLNYFVATPKRMALSILFVFSGSFLLSRISNLQFQIYSYIQSYNEIEYSARYYLSGDAYARYLKGIELIRAFIPISFIYICLYLNRGKTDNRQKVLKMLLFGYSIMATLNLFIPIFYRINEYLVFSYIVLMPMAIYEGVPNRLSLIKVLLFVIFILYPVNHLVAVHPAFGFPGYRIYYPYYSVFDPQIDEGRNKIIEY